MNRQFLKGWSHSLRHILRRVWVIKKLECSPIIMSLFKWATYLADFMKVEVDTASFTSNRMCTLNHTIFTLQSRSPNAFGEV